MSNNNDKEKKIKDLELLNTTFSKLSEKDIDDSINKCEEILNNESTNENILDSIYVIKNDKWYSARLFLSNIKGNNLDIKGLFWESIRTFLKKNKIKYKALEWEDVFCILIVIDNNRQHENKYYSKNKLFDLAKKYHYDKLKTDLKPNTLSTYFEKIEDIFKKNDKNEYSISQKGYNIVQTILQKIGYIYGDKNMKQQPLNQILYGPPGTGKTYNTVIKAMEIIKEEKLTDDNGNLLDGYDYKTLKEDFDKYKEQGQIQFITFHQSYSYEEFVEGIKPYIPEWGENNVQDVKYIGKDGIFKNICNIASSYSYFDNDLFEKAYNEFIEKNKDEDKIPLITPTGAKFAVRINKNLSSTIITGKNLDQETSGSITKEQIKYQTYTSIGRKGYMEGLTNYICKEYNLEKKKQINNNLNYVLIIDEINRGNISKIFGELITLIEEDKRENVTGDKTKEYNTIKVTLPYSGNTFTVPNNLYIIGTMNTADRSIALLDAALRRRFDFVEMMPQEELIEVTEPNKIAKEFKLSTFLKNLNDKISTQLGDDNYKIGHAYLMNLKTENDLERAICNKIFPLLQEYFYNEKKDLKDIVGYCSLSELKKDKNWKNFINKYSKKEDNSD